MPTTRPRRRGSPSNPSPVPSPNSSPVPSSDAPGAAARSSEPDSILARSRQIYAEATALPSARQRCQRFWDAIEPLQDFAAIDEIARQERAYLRQRYPNLGSLGTALSRNGYYKRARALELHEGRNAERAEKRDGNGRVVGSELRHRALRWIGLSSEEWERRNTSKRPRDREASPQENRAGRAIAIDSEAYEGAVLPLLQAEGWAKLALGLIAATGRRPHEVVAWGNFEPIEEDPYCLCFGSQQRGSHPFDIPVLCPAPAAIAALGRLREEATLQRIVRGAISAHPDDPAQQNEAIDRRVNRRLNPVLQSQTRIPEVVPLPPGKRALDGDTLRAIYAALVAARDLPDGSADETLLYAARALGYFIDEPPRDGDLHGVATATGYADIRIQGFVDFWRDRPELEAEGVAESAPPLSVSDWREASAGKPPDAAANAFPDALPDALPEDTTDSAAVPAPARSRGETASGPAIAASPESEPPEPADRPAEPLPAPVRGGTRPARSRRAASETARNAATGESCQAASRRDREASPPVTRQTSPKAPRSRTAAPPPVEAADPPQLSAESPSIASAADRASPTDSSGSATKKLSARLAPRDFDRFQRVKAEIAAQNQTEVLVALLDRWEADRPAASPTPPAAPQTPDAIATLAARLDTLQANLTALQSQQRSAIDRNEFEALRDRLAQLEGAAGDGIGPATGAAPPARDPAAASPSAIAPPKATPAYPTSYRRYDAALAAIETWNDRQPNNSTRWAINSRVLKTLAGGNRNVISQYLTERETRVSEANLKYGLGFHHNKVHAARSESRDLDELLSQELGALFAEILES